jgi:hypothetical protein
MHGVRSNTHFLTFKSSTHHGLKGNHHGKSYEENMDAVSTTKKSKSAYGHSKADVEAQILEWHEEKKFIK